MALQSHLPHILNYTYIIYSYIRYYFTLLLIQNYKCLILTSCFYSTGVCSFSLHIGTGTTNDPAYLPPTVAHFRSIIMKSTPLV